MNTNSETRREVIVKTTKDIVIVAVYVGLALIEFKAYRKVDYGKLGAVGKIVASTVLFNAAGQNLWKAYTKTTDIVSGIRDYRNRNMEIRRSEMEEFVKTYTQDDEYIKQMNDLFKDAVANI